MSEIAKNVFDAGDYVSDIDKQFNKVIEENRKKPVQLEIDDEIFGN